jgi:Methyltransferase small domain
VTEHSSFAGCTDSPTREDVQELRQAIESLRDHVQIVWQAIDEVREVIEQTLGHDVAEFWNVEPPQGFPLGRYRPFAGYEPFDEWHSENAGAVEPAAVLPTSNFDDAADTGFPDDSFENVPPATADAHPQNGHDEVAWPAIEPATQQRSLFGAVADSEPETAAIPANGVAESADALTSQKEAEPDTPGPAYTLDDWIVFRHWFSDGQVDAAGIHAEFQKLKAAKQHFVEQLVKTKSADQLRLMALQHGHLDARRNTKPQNAESVYRSCLTAFTLGESVCYQPMQETYEEAVERIVLAMTDDSIAAERKKSRQEREAREKALTNPETYAELSRFVSRKGTDQLSDEQLATWDRLNADISRNARKQKQKDTVEQFQSAEIEDATFRIIEGFHDRLQVPLWIVQLTSRVERATFNELKIKASQLGGWFSSFKKDSAGFQFRSKESAEKFAGLTDGDADRSHELLARKLRKMESASDRLNAVAASLEEKAAEVLAADDDKLKNTARRADMAASMRAQAYTDQADAQTLRSIAAALAAGDATYLDGIWNAAQVRTLAMILRQARRERINRRLKEEGSDRRTHGWSQRYDELETEPLSAADARFATFPKPYLYRNHLVQAFAQLGNTPGVKKATAKMRKLVDSRPKDQDFVEFVNGYQVEILEDFLARAKAAGSRVWWFDHCLDSYKRLRSAQLEDNHELRTALRELVPHLARADGDDPVTKAEDELRGKDLPGFFPTPRPVIEQMLDLAGIEQTHRILEPSCGKGDIIDAIRRLQPDVDLTAVEQNLTLQGVLTAKGYSDIVSYGDFLEHRGEYDRVLMNPPFEHGQDIDHVRHAYELLAAGGRLVSVVCEGPFFRSEQKSVAFREWLDELSADIEQLPEDAFQGVDAFRQTGVKTRLVTIDKA